MSTTAVPSPASTRVGVAAATRSLPARAIALFSGPVGFGTKIALLSIANALAIWALAILAHRGDWLPAGVLAAVTAVVDLLYLAPRRTVPAKFLVPGTLLLLAFQLIPIIYTVDVAFSRYSTGHVLSKAEAVAAIKQNSLAQSGNGYAMAPARDKDGNLVLILVDQDTNKAYVGKPSGLEPLAKGAVHVDAFSGNVSAPPGYKLVPTRELAQIDKKLADYRVPAGKEGIIEPQGLDSAFALKPTLRYDAKRDAFIRLRDGAVYRDDGRGGFARNGVELEPGWRTHIGFRNFSSMIHSPLIRAPFLRVFVWTIAFATLTVLVSFAIGLFLAITLDKRGLRFQRLYRTILVIPYASPGFLSLLVWQGLLNDEFGAVNKTFHIHIPWLFDPTWAKVSVILVSVWLTFPYFFLVSMGALQSIPTELYEAARVDGGGAWQLFRRVTLPLLLVVVAPLLIASFAFNFNNFNNIYLLTGGGPSMNNSPVAGSTDILISYTYKVAFAVGKGSDYGLASAIAIFIFFIVAVISAVSFSRTKALENLA